MVDFVEICNVCARKAIIEAAKRIINSDKVCRSYSDLNFGVTFFGTQCIYTYRVPCILVSYDTTVCAHKRRSLLMDSDRQWSMTVSDWFITLFTIICSLHHTTQSIFWNAIDRPSRLLCMSIPFCKRSAGSDRACVVRDVGLGQSHYIQLNFNFLGLRVDVYKIATKLSTAYTGNRDRDRVT